MISKTIGSLGTLFSDTPIYLYISLYHILSFPPPMPWFLSCDLPILPIFSYPLPGGDAPMAVMPPMSKALPAIKVWRLVNFINTHVYANVCESLSLSL